MSSESSHLQSCADDSVGDQGFPAEALVYFVAVVHGSQSASALASQYVLKDQFGLGPASVAFHMSFVHPGWVLKPLWGAITDCCPIFGQRRRPYLVLAAAAGAMLCLAYGLVRSLWQFVSLLAMMHVCMAFLSVLAQAWVVERSRGKSVAATSFGFTSYFGTRTIAAAVLVYIAGWLLDREPAWSVFVLCALVFVPILIVVPCISEAAAPLHVNLAARWSIMSEFFQDGLVRAVLLFLFVSKAMPSDSSAMFFFYTERLGFSATFLAVVTIAGHVGSVCGLIVYHNFLSCFPLRPTVATLMFAYTLFCAASLIQVLRLNDQMGIGDHAFTVTLAFLTRFVDEMVWIPVVVLAGRLCPHLMEGTSFALTLAVNNLGIWQSGLASAGLMTMLGITQDDLGNLWVLICLCCAATLAPVCLVPLLPASDSRDATV